MSETPLFNFHTTDYQAKFKQRMQDKPSRLTGATIVIDGEVENMASLFPNAMTTYTQLLHNLRSAKYLPTEVSMLDDFTVIGFPRSVLSFDKLLTVDMIVSVPDGTFVMEMFFNYKDGTSIGYTTSIHTGLATNVKPSEQVQTT